MYMKKKKGKNERPEESFVPEKFGIMSHVFGSRTAICQYRRVFCRGVSLDANTS